MMEWLRRATRRVAGEAALTPTRAWAIGGLLVAVAGWVIFNPVDRPLRLGSDDAAASTSTPDEVEQPATEWADLPEWSDTSFADAPDFGEAPTFSPPPTVQPEAATDSTFDQFGEDTPGEAGPVMVAWLAVYYTPPEGDQPTDEWLDDLAGMSTPRLMSDMQYVNPSLIPAGEPGELEWTRVSPSYATAQFPAPDGQLVEIAAANVTGDEWLVSNLRPAADLSFGL